MNTEIAFKKLGNHWYPSIEHDNLEEIQLDYKVERVLTMLSSTNEFNKDIVTICIVEQNTILYSNTIQFRDEDLNRYFTTNDDFDFIVYIGDRTFPISSALYSLLEELFNFNFHKTLYACNIMQ
jgi:hypothetical protein